MKDIRGVELSVGDVVLFQIGQQSPKKGTVTSLQLQTQQAIVHYMGDTGREYSLSMSGEYLVKL